MSDAWKIVSLVCLLVSISKWLMVWLVPISLEVLANGLLYMGKIYEFNNYNLWLNNDYGTIIADILINIISIFNIIICIFHYRFGNHFGLFFRNIETKKTPFIHQNILYLKEIRNDLIIIALFTIMKNIIWNCLKGYNEWNLLSVVIIILLFFLCAFIYIFEYGYEIQLNSSGIIYENGGESNE